MIPQNGRVILLAVGCCWAALAGCKQDATTLTTTATASTTHAATKRSVPDWTFQESDAAMVAPAFSVGAFTFRPPAEFEFIKQASTATKYMWAGPPRPDETYPLLTILMQRVPEPNPFASNDAMLADTLKGIERHRTEWSAGTIEHGTINGQPFVRAAWSGIADEMARKGLVGKQMHGMVYLTVLDGKFVLFMAEDAGADYEKWMKRAAVSISTFDAGGVSLPR